MIAVSATVESKAAALPVRYTGRGQFAVASGSEPGKVYTVKAPKGERDPALWSCSCPWGAHGHLGCSHVRAADAELARLGHPR